MPYFHHQLSRMGTESNFNEIKQISTPQRGDSDSAEWKAYGELVCQLKSNLKTFC